MRKFMAQELKKKMIVDSDFFGEYFGSYAAEAFSRSLHAGKSFEESSRDADDARDAENYAMEEIGQAALAAGAFSTDENSVLIYTSGSGVEYLFIPQQGKFMFWGRRWLPFGGCGPRSVWERDSYIEGVIYF